MNLLLTGLLAGLLDAVAAVLLFLARGNKDPRMLFRYIASALFGKAAFAKESSMVQYGDPDRYHRPAGGLSRALIKPPYYIDFLDARINSIY